MNDNKRNGMNSTFMNFNADSGVRLWDLMGHYGIDHRTSLQKSADTAGQQLELIKPGVIGSGKHSRLYAGSAVMVSPGTVLIVLAHHSKILTIWLSPGESTLTEGVEETVRYVNGMADEKELPSGSQALFLVESLVKKYGHALGKRGVELEHEHNARIIGMLFAAMPVGARAHILKGLEMSIVEGVCPVMVGLLGRGTKKGLSGVWPLLLPLAPYAEAVLA
jgi:hypothetical protein